MKFRNIFKKLIISSAISAASIPFIAAPVLNIYAQEDIDIISEDYNTDDADELITETTSSDDNAFPDRSITNGTAASNDVRPEAVVNIQETESASDYSDSGVKALKKIEKYTGWKRTNGKLFYYKDDIAYTGWHYMTAAEGEKTPHWSYFGDNGSLRTGWVRLTAADGEKTPHWSYFGDNGWLRTGWVRLTAADGEKTPHWSYFGDNGWLRTGWVRLTAADGEKTPHFSYFGDNGWLRTGWVRLTAADGEKTPHFSYFGDNGWLRTGWQQFGQGTANPDGSSAPHQSYFGDNGWLRVNEWYTDRAGLHRFDNRGWLVTGDSVIEGQLYTDNNSNGVLTKNTSKNGWYLWNTNWHWLVNGKVLKNFTGVTRINDQGTWYNIKDGVTTGPVKNEAILVHASGDENGKYTKGRAGDQIKSEVFFRTWYNRPWKYVFRAKNPATREKIVYAMERAALNEHIGYDMNERDTLYDEASKVGWDPGKVTTDCETDCSALVAVAMRYAGFSSDTVRLSIGTCFTTSTMKTRLINTGKFTMYSSDDYIKSADKLIRGDILLLENGHTAVVSKSLDDMKNN